MTSLQGKIAVVTGAANGIGFAIARRFAAAGVRVIVGDVNPPPPNFVYQRSDVSREDDVRALMRAAADSGGLDILINNAGVSVEKSIETTTVEEWEKTMAVNVRGVFLCTKHAFPLLRRRGGGVIINIGSIEGMGANMAHAAYAASKAAVHALTRNTAIEGGSDNIRCNAIAPGWIDTPFNDALVAAYPDPAAARAAIRGLHPLGRLGTPDDIAALAMWLAADDAAFANGQVYVHDGGRTARLPLPAL